MTSPSELPPSTGQSGIGAFFGRVADQARDLKDAVGKSWAIKATRRSIGNAQGRMSTIATNTGLFAENIQITARTTLRAANSVMTGKPPDVKSVSISTTDQEGNQKIHNVSNKTLNISCLFGRPSKTNAADMAAKQAVSHAKSTAKSDLMAAKEIQDPDKKVVRLLAANAALDEKSLSTGFAKQSGELSSTVIRRRVRHRADPKSVFENLGKMSEGRDGTTTSVKTSFGTVPHQIARDFGKGLGDTSVEINGRQITGNDREPEKFGTAILEMISPSEQRGDTPPSQNEKDVVCYALATLTQSAGATQWKTLSNLAKKEEITISEDRGVPRSIRIWVENNEVHTEYKINYRSVKSLEDGDMKEMDGITVTQHSSIPIDDPSAARHFPDTFTVYDRPQSRP